MWVLGMKKKSLFYIVFTILCFIGISNSVKAEDCSTFSTVACATCKYDVIGDQSITYNLKSDGQKVSITHSVTSSPFGSFIDISVIDNLKEADFLTSSGYFICPTVYMTMTSSNSRSVVYDVHKTLQALEPAVVPNSDSIYNYLKVYSTGSSETHSSEGASRGGKFSADENSSAGSNSSTGSSSSSDDDDSDTVAVSGCEVLPDELIEFLQTVLDYIRIIGIALAVILGIVDYMKATFGSDEKAMATANKHFSSRIIAVGLLFLIPTILSLVIGLFGIATDSAGVTCGVN